ncbi:hypothetical protein KSS87_015618, partial [Heliosperma pusillum]
MLGKISPFNARKNKQNLRKIRRLKNFGSMLGKSHKMSKISCFPMRGKILKAVLFQGNFIVAKRVIKQKR